MRVPRTLRKSAADGPLTAQDIRSARFGQSPMAWRGYSEEEVGAFLARVADTVESGEAEKSALRAEVERLRRFYREQGEPVDARPLAGAQRPEASPGDLPSQLRYRLDAMVLTAEHYADLCTGAVAEFAGDPAAARARADQLIAHAELNARTGADELVAGFLATYARHPATATELRRTCDWLDELAHALTRQLAALQDAAAHAGPDATAR